MIDVVHCTVDDILSDPSFFASKFLEDGVYGIRGLFASEEDQVEILLSLGDEIGWTPRHEDYDPTMVRRYFENHDHSLVGRQHSGEEYAVHWHLEHLHSSYENSTVAGFWNMLRFDCSHKVGRTYFKDNSKMLNNLPSDFVEFLRKCGVANKVVIDLKGNRTTEVRRDAIAQHPFKDVPVLRICQGGAELLDFEGRPPSDTEKDLFESYVDYIELDIVHNKDDRLIWEWEVGDMLISDLFVMSHAVSGGFLKGEREFLGYFCSHPSLDTAYLLD